jgi:hypothetical protein
MLRIKTQVWSHQPGGYGQKRTLKQVLARSAVQIRSFQELVQKTAELSYHNPEHVLFFRGQGKEYRKKSKGKWVTSFYPTIYRSSGLRLTDEELESRFKRLDQFSTLLRDIFMEKEIVGHEKLANLPEVVWAILQHYGVCDTPLLDLTHSLRVAASFALDTSQPTGFVFVFGFPHPNGSITYSVESELLNIRLLSICPPVARRPYFQEGFLVGSFPSRRVHKHPSLDVNVRLIAKFELLKTSFWDENFQPIPHKALFPETDDVHDICSLLSAEGFAS